MLFSRLATFFDRLEATSSRRSLVRILAELVAEADTDEIDRIIYLCQGRLAPVFEPIEIGMGEKLVAEAISLANGVSRADVLGRYAKAGDLGLVAWDLASERTGGNGAAESAMDRGKVGAITEPEDGPSVGGVFDELAGIATTSGAGSVERKLRRFAEMLAELEPVSAKHLVRIPLGKLRLGIGDPTMLDALSLAYVGDTSLRGALERAYNETSDLGLIARTLATGGSESIDEIRLRVGNPIRPALAERLPTAEAIIAKLGTCAVEPKFDGFRCQVHKDGNRVRIFSRNLEDLTAMFPEIVEAARSSVRARTAIFEGEAIAYNPASEEYLPFQETTRRRRKHGIAALAAEMPLRLFVFDLMYVDGENVSSRPYVERRALLQRAIPGDGAIGVTPEIVARTPAELEAVFLDNIGKGLEGVVAKRLDAPYQAGARNYSWVKLKRAQAGRLRDTVDCVVLGYIYGRGKRAAFGAGALLVGVYDAAHDEFTTVTKIGTGLSDEEWREIRRRCDAIMVASRPARVNAIIQPSVWVEPQVVVEVLADEITRSPVHTAGRRDAGSGYALRFPRLVSFRDADKRPEDATTVDEIVAMYEQQSVARTAPTSR